MTTALNGYSVLDYKSDVPAWIPGPHSSTQLEGYRSFDVADILMGLRWMQNAEIRPIEQLDAYRDKKFNDDLRKRGSQPALRSNHLCAMADDADWHINSFKRVVNRFLRQPHSFTKAQQRIRRDHRYIARGNDGLPVVRFGSDFGDDMHNEIAYGHTSNRYVPPSRIREAADRMRAVVHCPRSHAEIKDWQRTARPTVKPDGVFGKDSIAAHKKWQKASGLRVTGWITPQDVELRDSKPSWQTTTHIKRVQTLLNEVTDAELDVDGKWGPNLTAATKAYQRTNQLTVDGSPGPATLKALEADMSAISDLQGSVAELTRTVNSLTTVTLNKHTRDVTGAKVEELSLVKVLELLLRQAYSTGGAIPDLRDEVQAVSDKIDGSV